MMDKLKLLPLFVAISTTSLSISTDIYASILSTSTISTSVLSTSTHPESTDSACLVNERNTSSAKQNIMMLNDNNKELLKIFLRNNGYTLDSSYQEDSQAPLLINPILGTLMSDGQILLPTGIELNKIKSLIKHNSHNGIVKGNNKLSEKTVIGKNATVAIQSTQEIQKFEYFTLTYWNEWIKEKSLQERPKFNWDIHPILSSDGLINFINCQGKPIYSKKSVGYATLVTFARYAQSLGLDPTKLTVKELFAIGYGHEKNINNSNSAEISLYTQAALFFAHTNRKINLHYPLTSQDIETALKYYHRYYQASILYIEASAMYKNSVTLKALPTPESVAREILKENDLNPDQQMHALIGRMLTTNYTEALWKFYARYNRATGKRDPNTIPKLFGSDKKNWHKLPKLKDAFKAAIKNYRHSNEYIQYKKSLSLFFRTAVATNPYYSDDLVQLLLENKNAHSIKMAYYGISDKALMYFDPKLGENGEHGLVIFEDTLNFISFQNRDEVKEWLKDHYHQQKFRHLFSQIPDDVWGDTVPKYFDEFIYGDNWTWRWKAFFWEKAIDFPRLANGHPFETIIDRELDSYRDKTVSQIVTAKQLWIQGLHQLIAMIPFIGQPIDLIWNLAEGNTEAALIDIAFIATELPDDIAISLSLFKKGKPAFNSLMSNAPIIAASTPDVFNFSKRLVNNRELSSPLQLDHATHPVQLTDSTWVSYNSQGYKIKSIHYNGELVNVTADQNKANTYYPTSKNKAYLKFTKNPQTGIFNRANRFEHLNVGDNPYLWPHPVTGDELKVVRIQNEDRLAALKQTEIGALREVDFGTGELIPNAPLVSEGRDFKTSKPIFETRSLKGGGLSNVDKRRLAKHYIVEKLVSIVEIGRGGARSLTEAEQTQVTDLVAELVTHTDNSIQKIMQKGKGFKVRPKMLTTSDYNTLYEYLRRNIDGCEAHCGQSLVSDIATWVKQIIEKHNRTFTRSEKDSILGRLEAAHRQGEDELATESNAPPQREPETPKEALNYLRHYAPQFEGYQEGWEDLRDELTHKFQLEYLRNYSYQRALKDYEHLIAKKQ